MHEQSRFAVMWREALVFVSGGGIAVGALLWRWSVPDAAVARAPRVRHAAVQIPPVPDYSAHPMVDPTERASGPRRIVSTSPQLTEICCALGLLDRLVGRSSFCNYPPEVKRVTSVGALIDLNVEQCARLKAELILISGQSDLIRERLDSVGLKYVSLPDRSLEDIYIAIEQLGRLVDRPRTAAGLVNRIQQDLARLGRYRAERPKRVLMVTGKMTTPPRAPWVAGPGSYLDGLLALAGHRNAVADLRHAYGAVSLEHVVSVEPEAILEFWPGHEVTQEDQNQAYMAWSMIGRLSAVESGQLYLIPGQVHLVPGPRVAHTLREVMLALSD